MRRLALSACVAGLAFATVSCNGATDASWLAGTYFLETVTYRDVTSGPPAVTGSFYLTPSGSATRSIRQNSRDYVAVGTFSLGQGFIWFALREDNGRSAYVWTVRGHVTGRGLSISHPDPGDGPDIVEVYSRR